MAFAIYMGLVIETLLFSREIRNKLVLRNVSFLLTFDFSPILLFLPIVLCDKHGGYWLQRNSFAANMIPCTAYGAGLYAGRVETLVLYSHIETLCIKDFHIDFYLFFSPQN